MTTELYIQCYVACLIGNLIHLAIAYRSRSKDFTTLNNSLGLLEFIKMEKAALISDFFASMGLVYIANEWIDSPYIMGKIKTAFVLVGFTGSYAILALTGRSKAKFRQEADNKSNIADYGTPEKPKE